MTFILNLIVEQFIFFGFYDIAYTPLLIAYTVEILPFKIRAKGFACMVSHRPLFARTVANRRLFRASPSALR